MTDVTRYTLSLPQPLNLRIKNKAKTLGLPVATFIRHLIIAEVLEEDKKLNKRDNKRLLLKK